MGISQRPRTPAEYISTTRGHSLENLPHSLGSTPWRNSSGLSSGTTSFCLIPTFVMPFQKVSACFSPRSPQSWEEHVHNWKKLQGCGQDQGRSESRTPSTGPAGPRHKSAYHTTDTSRRTSNMSGLCAHISEWNSEFQRVMGIKRRQRFFLIPFIVLHLVLPPYLGFRSARQNLGAGPAESKNPRTSPRFPP